MAEQELSDADLDRAERAADQVLNDMVGELGAATLAGDVHNRMLALVKGMPEPFGKLNEAAQDDMIRRLDDLARFLVISAVEICADKGFEHITVTLGKFSLNGTELKGAFDAKGTEDIVLQLTRHQGRDALVVFADAKEFLGARGIVRADPDEPDLPLDQPENEGGGFDGDPQPGIEGDSGHEAEEENEPLELPATEGADPAAAAAARAWSEEDGGGKPAKV